MVTLNKALQTNGLIVCKKTLRKYLNEVKRENDIHHTRIRKNKNHVNYIRYRNHDLVICLDIQA